MIDIKTLQWGRNFAVALAAILAAITIIFSSGVYAQQSDKKQKTRRTPAISEQVYKRLAEAQELIDEKDSEAARNLLTKLSTRKGQNGYERASVHNMLGFLAYSDEDYPTAIQHYRLTISDREKIPRGLEQATLYTLSQLAFIQEDYADSIDYLNDWFSGLQTDPGPNPYVFMAQVYYQLKDFKKAVPAVKEAIKIAETTDVQVKENWWLLLRAMYFELEEYAKVIEIIEILVRDFPKKEYWVQLSGLYGQEGKEVPQMQAIDAAYIDNILDKEREILNLVGLLMQSDIPYRAAVILEKAIEEELVERTSKNMKMLAQAWQIAQEIDKTIPVLEEAAQKSDKGDLYLHLAQVYLEKDVYGNCAAAIDSALRKGDLKREGLAYEVQGMCRFNQDLLSEASLSFREAKKLAQKERDLPTTHRIDKWLRHIDYEQKRRDALDNS